MLLRWAIDQRVEKKSPGSQVDDRRSSDTSGINISARKTRSHRRTDVCSLPNHWSRRGVKRIDVVRFRHGDDHRPAWPAFDIKRLGVNVPGDDVVEVQVARQ